MVVSLPHRHPLGVAARSDASRSSPLTSDVSAPELSVVMPCLDEADTVGTCVEKALRAIDEHGIAGEVIVADNGSSDGSREIAERLGARVVRVTERGYGSALMGGIAAARGTYVIMGDADDSYDFAEIPRVLERLRAGYDLVQGCRLTSGGGTLLPGAMPFLHRWWGNPMFSWLARRWFGAPVHDVYCGLRGFTRVLYDRLDQRCTGMEFATEMIIKASLYGARIADVPITLHPDGRRSHPPHLKTFRDGWRTLAFFLMYSPRWLFVYPGAALIALGLVGYAIAMPRLSMHGVTFDAHTLLFASLAIICGYQTSWFAVIVKTFAIQEGLHPPPRGRRSSLLRAVTLERGIIAGLLAILAGLVLLGDAVLTWRDAGFGSLDYGHTMRRVIPGVTLTAVGLQTVLSSFVVSVLRLQRR